MFAHRVLIQTLSFFPTDHKGHSRFAIDDPILPSKDRSPSKSGYSFAVLFKPKLGRRKQNIGSVSLLLDLLPQGKKAKQATQNQVIQECPASSTQLLMKEENQTSFKQQRSSESASPAYQDSGQISHKRFNLNSSAACHTSKDRHAFKYSYDKSSPCVQKGRHAFKNLVGIQIFRN